MLTVNSGIDYRKSNVSFGTNLVLGKGVVDHLNKHPEELKKIQDFKNYLANDGKNWNAELTYDTFTPQQKPKAEDVEALIRKEAEDYDYNRRKIIAGLISVMQPKDAAALIEKLAQDPDPYVKREAVDNACKISDENLALQLIDKFAQNPTDEIKEAAIYALLELDNKEKRNEKVKQFLNSDDILIKTRAMRILGKDDFDNADEVISRFSNDSHPQVRASILYEIADFDEEKYAKNPKLYDSVIENAFKDSNEEVKRAAMFSLGKISDSKKAVELIDEAVNSDAQSWHRAKAARSAQYIKDHELARVTIEKLLQHPDSEVRRGAAEAGLRIKDKEIQKEFVQKLSDSPIVGIRKEMLWASYDLDDSQRKNLIEKFLNDQEPDIRELAANRINSIEDNKQRDELITKYIKSPDLSIRKGVADTVNNISSDSPEKATEYAQILLKDEDKYIQKQAREILEKIKLQGQKDAYSLKINDGDKALGQKKVQEPRYGEVNFLEAFFNTYKRIVESAKTN